MEEPVKQQTVCFDAEKKLEELRKQQTVYSDAIKKLEEQFKEETLMNQNISQLKTQKECEMFEIVFLSEDDMKVKYKEEDIQKLFMLHQTDIKKIKEYVEMLDKDTKNSDEKIKNIESELNKAKKVKKKIDKEEDRLRWFKYASHRDYDVEFVDLSMRKIKDFIMNHTFDDEIRCKIGEECFYIKNLEWLEKEFGSLKNGIHLFYSSHIDEIITEPQKFKKEFERIKEYYEIIDGFENGLHLDEMREICSKWKPME